MDGKTFRGPIAKGATNGLHRLAVPHTKNNAVVWQTALTAPANEISAAQRLLPKAEIAGNIVTGAAIFAQRARVAPSRQAGWCLPLAGQSESSQGA